jgi:hypothetical protein
MIDEIDETARWRRIVRAWLLAPAHAAVLSVLAGRRGVKDPA